MSTAAVAAAKSDNQTLSAAQPILGDHFAMAGLSDIERILLVSDGTFTYQLETFVREPIGVEILFNKLSPVLPSTRQLLGCDAGISVWDRHTLLRGKKTGTPYVYALCYINDNGLDPNFREELRTTQTGIGHLLAKYRMGTYREPLTYHVEEQPEYGHHLPDFPGSAFLSRTYRIIFDTRPIMIITENMPRDLFGRSYPLERA